MYTALSSLGKNLILIGIVVISATNFFYGWFSWKDLLAIQTLAGLAFVFLSCYEFLNAQYKASLPLKRYSYFTNSYVMFKIIKITMFLTFSVLFYKIKYIVSELYQFYFRGKEFCKPIL